MSVILQISVHDTSKIIQNSPAPTAASMSLSLMRTLLEHPVFLRALTRARLFTGTISAGGGSCQVTCRKISGGASNPGCKEDVSYGSIPCGNRTSYNGAEGVNGPCKPLWAKGLTRMTCGLLDSWKELVRENIRDAKVGLGRGLHRRGACDPCNGFLFDIVVVGLARVGLSRISLPVGESFSSRNVGIICVQR